MMTEILSIILVLFATMSLAHNPERSTSALPGGTICVEKIPVDVKKADEGAFGPGAIRPLQYDFSVQIGDRKATKLVLGKSIRINDIELDKPLLVRIRDGNKTLESFWFTFSSSGKQRWCLFYKPGYQTWSLVPSEGGANSM